jgi:hypothetical protein
LTAEFFLTQKEAMTMKRILVFAAALGLCLVFGLAFAGENITKTKDATLDPDSLINYLDPINAPARVVPEATGLFGLEVTGSAAGSMRENPDSLINFLDPANAPSATVPRGPAARVAPDNPDSVIHFISPAGK